MKWHMSGKALDGDGPVIARQKFVSICHEIRSSGLLRGWAPRDRTTARRWAGSSDKRLPELTRACVAALGAQL
jgi:hypothetical protein